MSIETLHYESTRAAQQLFNADPKNLRLLEDKLAIKATSREGWIRLEGEPESIEIARLFFELMESSTKEGLPPRNRDFAHALEVCQAHVCYRRSGEIEPP